MISAAESVNTDRFYQKYLSVFSNRDSHSAGQTP